MAPLHGRSATPAAEFAALPTRCESGREAPATWQRSSQAVAPRFCDVFSLSPDQLRPSSSRPKHCHGLTGSKISGQCLGRWHGGCSPPERPSFQAAGRCTQSPTLTFARASARCARSSQSRMPLPSAVERCRPRGSTLARREYGTTAIVHTAAAIGKLSMRRGSTRRSSSRHCSKQGTWRL